ncbi:MAG TPA: hypothetical protein VGQ72_12990 [Pyrinomonadaceae bacterium]|nr:hypothetical protein [Pyrinomonadaceae bacterium]
MPRLLRILGALLAATWTLVYVLLAGLLLNAALPFIYGFLLPLFAGTLVLIVLSVVFAAIVEVTGTGTPPSIFAHVCAIAYLILSTVVLVFAVGAAALFTAFLPEAVILGVVAMFFFLLPHALQVLVCYILAAVFAPFAPFTATSGGVDRPFECFFRGTLVGMNAIMNGVFGVILYGVLFMPLAAAIGAFPVSGVIIGYVLTLILVLVTFSTSLASANVPPALPAGGVVQGFIKANAGWLSWLMPMSWADCAYGWASFYVSWIGHFLSLLAPATFPSGTWSILALRLDATTGAMILDGGVAGSASNTAYNCGCFSFVSPARAGILVTRQHETGHHLHLAAFGGFFSSIDGINENGFGPISPQGALAYGERVAESNTNPARGRTEVPVWR